MDQSLRRPDCLNTIRLLAALQVVFMHTKAHLQLNVPEFVSWLLGFFSGVPIFFTLSGFLIWQSIGRSRSCSDYVRKRFWRIYPELWCAVVIEAIVIFVLGYQLIRWPDFGLFLIGQSTILQFWTPDSLRSYGCGVPNGSLWTICVIIQFYLVAWPLHKFISSRSIFRWLISISLLVIVSVITNILYRDSVGFKLLSNSIIPYLWMFSLGAMIAEYRDKVVPVLIKYWWIPLMLFIFVKTMDYDVHGLKFGFSHCHYLFIVLSVCKNHRSLWPKEEESIG